MEIHPPDGPTHSIKDFAIHITIVTVGILIALGLEGVRETWREHAAVAEARESFHQELSLDRQRLEMEIANVRKVNRELDLILTELPVAVKAPEELTKRVMALGPSFYFFRSTAWESAVASGVLSHMNSDEVNRFADVYMSIRNYQDAQKAAIPEWIAATTYFRSHRTFNAAEEVAADERLLTLQAGMQTLAHLGAEFSADLGKAK